MNRPMIKFIAGALGAAVFALVLTLGGTAFAAGGDLGAVDKQAVPVRHPLLLSLWSSRVLWQTQEPSTTFRPT